MKRLAGQGTHYFLQFGFYVTALRPIPRAPPLLNLIYRLCWLTALFGLIFLMFHLRMYDGDVSIGGLVGTALFVCNAFVYAICIGEVIFKHGQYRKLRRLQREVDALIGRHLRGVKDDLHIQQAPILLRLLPLLILQYTCDGLKIWIHKRSYISPVFWPSIMVVQGLRMRYIQIIRIIMEANQRVALLKRSLRQKVRLNQPKAKYCSEVWKPCAEWEYDQLHVLRLIYGRIFELYQTVNGCFGWSILAIFLTSFFDFVCNAFWSFAAHQKFQSFDKFVYNGGTSIALGTLVSMLFWCTDVSHDNSRYIGCIIFKLVKPLGNKSYNDLLSELSLQVLHQQFVITAKEFFNLNLNLLGSMVAAIVTYLIILIQFMISEKSNTEKALATPVTFNATSYLSATETNAGV